MSPPGRIQGKWSIKDNSSGNKGWKFTPDEVIEIDADGNEFNPISVFLFTAGLTGEEVTEQEFEGTNSYSILIDGETFSRSYDFSRISNQEMSWDNAPFNAPEHYLKTE